MGNVRFYDNKILFNGNAVAMHEDCCCEEDEISFCDLGEGDDLNITFTGIEGCEPHPIWPGDCTDYNDITYRLEWYMYSGGDDYWKIDFPDPAWNGFIRVRGGWNTGGEIPFCTLSVHFQTAGGCVGGNNGDWCFIDAIVEDSPPSWPIEFENSLTDCSDIYGVCGYNGTAVLSVAT